VLRKASSAHLDCDKHHHGVIEDMDLHQYTGYIRSNTWDCLHRYAIDENNNKLRPEQRVKYTLSVPSTNRALRPFGNNALHSALFNATDIEGIVTLSTSQLHQMRPPDEEKVDELSTTESMTDSYRASPVNMMVPRRHSEYVRSNNRYRKRIRPNRGPLSVPKEDSLEYAEHVGPDFDDSNYHQRFLTVTNLIHDVSHGLAITPQSAITIPNMVDLERSETESSNPVPPPPMYAQHDSTTTDDELGAVAEAGSQDLSTTHDHIELLIIEQSQSQERVEKVQPFDLQLWDIAEIRDFLKFIGEHDHMGLLLKHIKNGYQLNSIDDGSLCEIGIPRISRLNIIQQRDHYLKGIGPRCCVLLIAD
jgi:hypothetical protein